MNLGNLDFQLIVLGKILLAMLLGGVIGFERETAHKPAGLRTHMLVGGAAALLVGLSTALVQSFVEADVLNRLTSDPIRVIEAVIVGVSFLGTGTIFRRKDGDGVEGLTTAASLLFAAGVGVAVAVEQPLLAVGSAVLVVLINRVLGLVASRITPKNSNGN